MDKPTIQLKAELETTLIEFNKSKTLLASFSGTLNVIKIWTLLNEEYVFEITDD
jgi:transducin (beta)-like 1